jgi:hypothetical protein
MRDLRAKKDLPKEAFFITLRQAALPDQQL